jgi:hypothetical protein
MLFLKFAQQGFLFNNSCCAIKLLKYFKIKRGGGDCMLEPENSEGKFQNKKVLKSGASVGSKESYV